MEQINAKLSLIMVAMNISGEAFTTLGETAVMATDAAAALSEALAPDAAAIAGGVTTSGADLSKFDKWDFSDLDKEMLPADERIHGIVSIGGGEKGFKKNTAGLWTKRRSLKPEIKVAVAQELAALLIEWREANNGESFDAAIIEGVDTPESGTPPPPPPGAAAAGNPPPPPGAAAAGNPPPPPPANPQAVFVKAVDTFLKETSVNTECFMHYLSDTFGAMSTADIVDQVDRDSMVGDLAEWQGHLASAQVEVDKIMAAYKGHEEAITPALITLFGANFTNTKGKAASILDVQHDDIAGATTVLADYYALILAG